MIVTCIQLVIKYFYNIYARLVAHQISAEITQSYTEKYLFGYAEQEGERRSQTGEGRNSPLLRSRRRDVAGNVSFCNVSTMPNRKEKGAANPEYSCASLIFNFQFSIFNSFVYLCRYEKMLSEKQNKSVAKS
jgi:hypothetical protein